LETPSDREAVKSFFEMHRRFIALGHREPDGDCVGSQLVLETWLERRGKEVSAVSVGPFDRPEISVYADRFTGRFEPHDVEPGTALVLVDCSGPERTGLGPELLASLEALPSLVIDHHAAGRRHGSLHFIDPEVPSTTLLVLDLMESMGDEPTEEEAELLLFGFCTDTGFFRHLSSSQASALGAVQRLVERGASPREVYRRIYTGRNLEQFRLLGRLLARVEAYAGGKVLISWQTLEESTAFGKNLRGSDDFYRHLQSVSGNELAVLIKEEEDGRCSVGLRSTGALNVGELAHSLGGGGHVLASGYTEEGSADQVKARLLEALSGFYPVTPSSRTA